MHIAADFARVCGWKQFAGVGVHVQRSSKFDTSGPGANSCFSFDYYLHLRLLKNTPTIALYKREKVDSKSHIRNKLKYR